MFNAVAKLISIRAKGALNIQLANGVTEIYLNLLSRGTCGTTHRTAKLVSHVASKAWTSSLPRPLSLHH